MLHWGERREDSFDEEKKKKTSKVTFIILSLKIGAGKPKIKAARKEKLCLSPQEGGEEGSESSIW